MTERIYNFSSGPAVLPLPVLEQVQRDLVALPGVGMSILEISHRSKTFESIIQTTVDDIRKLDGVGTDYHVLFTQGGASMQFSMVPMNLLLSGAAADYIVTGVWSKKAVQEARKVGAVNIAASTESDNFNRIPDEGEIKVDPQAAYAHFTSNNTIFGTEWKAEPAVGTLPLIADMSSDIFSRPIDVSKYALIYAGAQKNLGPAGVTLVIAKNKFLDSVKHPVPSMLQYRTHADNESMYNTCPTFGIYVMSLVLKWIKAQGGLQAMDARNRAKAEK